MKLRFTVRATRDVAQIADYIHEHSPNAALRVRAAILESLQELILFPELGRRQTVEGVRKLLTRKYPYLVYYNLNSSDEEIVILTISTRRASGSTRIVSSIRNRGLRAQRARSS